MFISHTSQPQILHILHKKDYSDWLDQQSKFCQQQLGLHLSKIKQGAFSKWQDEKGHISAILITEGDIFPSFGPLSKQLTHGDWVIQIHHSTNIKIDIEQALTAYFMGCYQFDKYKKDQSMPTANIVIEDAVLLKRLEVKKKAIFLTRDLINEPVNHLNPIILASIAQDIAKEYNADINIFKDSALKQAFPMVYAVGKSAPDTARVIDIRWHKKNAPKITLIGKGVCFDTGGVNIKPDRSMRNMKKDMGGAANVLGLASMIMGLDLPIDLRVLIPTVENNVSTHAFRPGDIYQSRSGKTIEIGHTDAEGRLILSDILTFASEEKNDYIIDMATLTGAARVALGAEVTPVLGNDADAIHQIIQEGDACGDYLWQLPLFEGYRRHLSSSVADINNAAEGAAGMGGTITAGLFLSEFVGDNQKWMHFDVFSWNINDSQAGHPIGGEAMAIRAILAWLEKLSLS